MTSSKAMLQSEPSGTVALKSAVLQLPPCHVFEGARWREHGRLGFAHIKAAISDIPLWSGPCSWGGPLVLGPSV